MTTPHTASRSTPVEGALEPCEVFGFTSNELCELLASTVDMFIEYRDVHGYGEDRAKPAAAQEIRDGVKATRELASFGECKPYEGDRILQPADPAVFRDTIRQMHVALRMALRDWPWKDEGNIPRFYNAGDMERINEIRAACEAADRLPRSVRG